MDKENEPENEPTGSKKRKMVSEPQQLKKVQRVSRTVVVAKKRKESANPTPKQPAKSKAAKEKQPAKSKATRKPKTKKVKAIEVANPTPDFEVDEIVDHKRTKNGMRYLVKWRGFEDSDDDTWEPESSFSGCKKLLKEYRRVSRLN